MNVSESGELAGDPWMEPLMPDQELSLEELEFLATALDGPMLAFEPMSNPMIVDLLERKLLKLLSSSDQEHSLLELTDAGKQSVWRQLR